MHLLSLLLILSTPPDAANTDAIVKTATAKPAVCVHLGCGDGTLTARLAANGNLLVHALEADPARVEAARTLLRDRGLYGQATVEPWTGARLPHVDALVNFLVAERPGRIPEQEILRVLAPGGTAWIRRGETWKQVEKPVPTRSDEWTHWRHGADGNMVSRDTTVTAPDGLRWVAGPPQDAGGRKWYYDHVLVTSAGRNFYAYETEIVCRDAYNGRLIWRRPVKGHANPEKGTKVTQKGSRFLGKAGRRTSKVRPVAVGDKLYAISGGHLVVLDGATGRKTFDYGEVNGPQELFVDDGRLVVGDLDGVRAYEPDSLAPIWEAKGIVPRRMVAGDGKVFCLSKSSVVTLDAKTGKVAWTQEDKRLAEAGTASYRGGVLAVERSTWLDEKNGCGLMVYSGADGKLLWERDYRPGMTHFQEARALFTGDKLWLLSDRAKLIGLDPKTGKQITSLPTNGKHCASPVATDRFFLAPECDFTDLETGKVTKARMFKSACRLPFIPANGLLYTFPVQCECYPMLRGYMALGQTPKTAEAPAPLLKPRGGDVPALETVKADWPTYRHDPRRSGSTGQALSGTKKAWTAEVCTPRTDAHGREWSSSPFIRGPLTPPVAAGGLLVVAVPNEHRVVGLDAETGRERWSFTAGGRVDMPPTIAGGLCLFGSHDGRITALRASDGAPAWSYRAAPAEARLMAYGQIESPWPVPGSVLVVDGIAYAAAGRHPNCDGGIRVVALRVATGERVWEKKVDDFTLRGWYGPRLQGANQKVGLDFEPVDMMVRDGDKVSMSRWRFDPKTGDYKLETNSITYPIGKATVPRGHWDYGIRQTKKLFPVPPLAAHAGKVHKGAKGDVALIVAGGTPIAADAKGGLRIGKQTVTLDAAPVWDGLIVARGRLYASLRNGTVVCLR